jgi:Protein of unknown function (DUF3298)
MRLRLLLPALFLLGSCEEIRPPAEPPPEAPKCFVFDMRTKEKTFDGCVAGAEGCAYIRFDYPVILEAPQGAAVEAVTQSIVDFLVRPLRDEDGSKTITALMDSFIQDYGEMRAREPRSAAVWYLERKAFVLESAPNLLSLSFSERSFLGGAGQTATLRFRDLDPKTGADVALADLLRPGAEEMLRTLAEARFRKVRNIPQETSLAAAGFTFDDGTFHLTDNFSLDRKGITFYYNTSEIAPAALGPTEILLTYAEVADLLDPRYLPDEAT